MGEKPRVLMIGAARDVRGGVSSVVNEYYAAGLDRLCALGYLATMKDGSKLNKLWTAAGAYLEFPALMSRYEILHVHMSARNSFHRKRLFIRVAKRMGKKIVIQLHSGQFPRFYAQECGDGARAVIRETYAMADRVIALSREQRDFLSREICPREKITVLHNGVRLPEYLRADYGDNRTVLFLGRLCKNKGTYDLIEAAAQVLEKYPKTQFLLGGAGEVEQVRALCRERGLASAVRCLGWVRGEEKERLLREAAVCVLPSYYECMPMSLLEAMSYGIPCVAAPVGGVPEMITHGKDGLLCPPGDVEGLSASVCRLLGDQGLRRRLGQAGREKVAGSFHAEEQVKALAELYETL